jgi:mRNA-degrading endonuclease RelE of RelBE toxin-antitoxin system
MSKLRITIAPEAVRQIDEAPKRIQVRLLDMFERLRDWPDVSGVRSLRGELTGHYRMRTGHYRMQFRVHGGEIVIEKVGHRDGFYDD